MIGDVASNTMVNPRIPYTAVLSVHFHFLSDAGVVRIIVLLQGSPVHIYIYIIHLIPLVLYTL